MKCAVYVGGISSKTLTEVGKQIKSILNTKADQETIGLALTVLEKSVASATTTNISNCSFEMGKNEQ